MAEMANLMADCYKLLNNPLALAHFIIFSRDSAVSRNNLDKKVIGSSITITEGRGWNSSILSSLLALYRPSSPTKCLLSNTAAMSQYQQRIFAT